MPCSFYQLSTFPSLSHLPFFSFFKSTLFSPSFLANPSMFFSKVVLFAISLSAVLVHATPHNHHALHRRVAARVASTPSNSSAVSVKRQNSAKCSHRSIPHSSSAPSSTIPAVTAIVSTPQSKPSPLTSSAPSSTPPPPPPPSTTSTPQPPPPSTTSAPAPSPSSGANGPFSGDGTFFASSSISLSCFRPF